MKSFRKALWFNLPARRGFVNITSQVEEWLQESGIKDSFVLVNKNEVALTNAGPTTMAITPL